MHSIPTIMIMPLVLGMRHGVDLDHLSVIDTMTRTLVNKKKLSRLVGLLFSLGHGLVVILISGIVGAGLVKTAFPDWLKSFGDWVSVVFLLFFSTTTLYLLVKNNGEKKEGVGLKSELFSRVVTHQLSPITIVLVGALFAISFDTFSQVALFSISASMVSGWLFSIMLGLVFMLGMMLSDGLNGFVVSKIINRVGKLKRYYSLVLGLCICLFGLFVSVTEAIKLV